MPCRGDSAAASTNPPRTQPTTTESLKKSVRGFCGLISFACTLVFENTAIWDSIGIFSSSRTDRK